MSSILLVSLLLRLQLRRSIFNKFCNNLWRVVESQRCQNFVVIKIFKSDEEFITLTNPSAIFSTFYLLKTLSVLNLHTIKFKYFNYLIIINFWYFFSQTKKKSLIASSQCNVHIRRRRRRRRISHSKWEVK